MLAHIIPRHHTIYEVPVAPSKDKKTNKKYQLLSTEAKVHVVSYTKLKRGSKNMDQTY